MAKPHNEKILKNNKMDLHDRFQLYNSNFQVREVKSDPHVYYFYTIATVSLITVLNEYT